MSLRTAWQRVRRGSGNTAQAPNEAFALWEAEERWPRLCFRLAEEPLAGFFEKQVLNSPPHPSRLSSDLTEVMDMLFARKELSILKESVEFSVALQARHANDMVSRSRTASLPSLPPPPFPCRLH